VLRGFVVLDGLDAHEGHAAGAPLLGQLLNAPVELRDRLRELLLPRRVRRRLELPLHLGPREAARFELAHALGIGPLGALTSLPSFLFAFFHALGEAAFRVDEAFSSVTHISPDYDGMNAQCTMPNA
jgi:hypothetical protein